MRHHFTLFSVAARYQLIEHARNQLAMILVLVFVPLWIIMVRVVIPDRKIPFRLRATREVVAPVGHELSQISGAIHVVTLIAGFMMFAAAFGGGAFDRRLAMAGYSRTHLILAKTACLALASAVLAAYATGAICACWSPRHPLLLATALYGAAMTYGALGVALGALLRREVEGMFILVMTGVIEVALQNPITSSGADNPLIRLLPSYGATQAGIAAGFSTHLVPDYLVIQLIWFVAAALLGLFTFHCRTRTAQTGRRPSHTTTSS